MSDPGMLSTGVEPLDRRIGGLRPGRHHLVCGAPGSGKTTLALHFLAAGFEAGERGVIVTCSPPPTLLEHGDLLGVDLRRAAQKELLTVLRYRPDAIWAGRPSGERSGAADRFLAALDGSPPERLVVDSVLPFLAGDAATEGADVLASLVRELPSTTYLTVPGRPTAPPYLRVYDRVTSPAAAIFTLRVPAAGEHELVVRKLSREAPDPGPLRLAIRPGVGIVETSGAGRPGDGAGRSVTAAGVRNDGRAGTELRVPVER